jgi:DNA modification methylase
MGMTLPKEIVQVLAGDRQWHLEQGDCRELLRLLPDNCIDAVVVDLPYEIGFMGQSWDRTGIAFDVEMWKQVLRVLKPGAHILSFGGTRTYHRMACAIEDAGAWFRDQIDWIYGSGMPKSQNISKAIDRKAGAQRRVVGTRTLTGNAAQTTKEKGGTYGSGTDARGVPAKTVDVTESATDEAKHWDGFGTNLKPGHEPIAMAMKPLDGTFEHNVRKWGTGAINVDACRVSSTGPRPLLEHTGRSGQIFGSGLDGSRAIGTTDAGRWPANLLLSHAEGCERVGSRKVKAAPPWNDNRPPSLFTGAQTSPVHHTDGDGFETVDDYRCAEGCPVGMLDGQSGDRRSAYPHNAAGAAASAGRSFESSGYGGNIGLISGASYSDVGSAARYFATFPWEPFFYEPKASRVERERGLEWMDEETVGDGRKKAIDNPYQRGKTARRNTHTTVKPVGVVRYCTRLICRPGGLVLDFTCGSGTGGIAALAEGCRWLGFELKPKHVAIARARIIGDNPLFNSINREVSR